MVSVSRGLMERQVDDLGGNPVFFLKGLSYLKEV